MNNLVRRHTAYLLLLLYIGYAGSVSLFVHSHIYQGVLYIHSHPFSKSTQKKGPQPIEADHHTPHTFFTLNQLSLILSSGVKTLTYTQIIRPLLQLPYNHYIQQYIDQPFIYHFNLRAPPIK